MILIVIGNDELRSVLEAALESYDSPYPCHVVKSAQEARWIVQTQVVECLAMTDDVALLGDDGKEGLQQQLPSTLPTVTLIAWGNGYPAYLYDPKRFHDWCRMPFDLDELFTRVERVMARATKK